jgi:hypothetical protein
VDWGPLDGVDETVLPRGCRDDDYLVALARLLARMPPAELAFVVAGGDVLAGDPLGNLALSLDGIRRRDALVLQALGRTASVWLPGGGYHGDAWRALAGTALVVAGRADQRIPAGYDPLSSRYAWLSRSLDRAHLSDEPLTEEALAADLGIPGAGPPRLLGYYTAEGIELALERYGILSVLESLGYREFRVAIGRASIGDQMRLYGQAAGREHLLIDCVLDRALVSDAPVLFGHGLELRHPLAEFGPDRPALPGQTVPGPGLAREAGELLGRVAARLELAGVAFRPSAYHVAYAASTHHLRFVDPARQRRFEALLRRLEGVPLLEATRAVAEGRVTLDGKPYTWEPEVMCRWLSAEATRTESRPVPDGP